MCPKIVIVILQCHRPATGHGAGMEHDTCGFPFSPSALRGSCCTTIFMFEVKKTVGSSMFTDVKGPHLTNGWWISRCLIAMAPHRHQNPGPSKLSSPTRYVAAFECSQPSNNDAELTPRAISMDCYLSFPLLNKKSTKYYKMMFWIAV